ncbi:zinc finger protein 831 [Sardina pilchardus]|uniref:zinc finger protein 831 n=1 Tax=Sardina pilchardus TaxID=27697 RepID=UPI002E1074A8
METGKLGFVQTAVPEGSVAVTAAAHEAAADMMHVQAPPLATFFVRAMTGPSPPQVPPPPAVPTQTQPTQAQLPAAAIQDTPAITLPMPALSAKQPLPILTLHIAGGMPLAAAQGLKPGGATLAPCPSSKPPKSVGKHVCQYCGRDCLKPSVLEKHLRCHTGERPYPCTVCRVSFKTQSNLYKHKRTQAHARISSESDRGLSLSSQESLHGSRDTCFSSSLSLDAQSLDCGSQDGMEVAVKPPPLGGAGESADSGLSHSSQEDTPGSGTARALQQAALVGLIVAPMDVQKEALTPQPQQMEPPCGGGVTTAGRDSKRLAMGEGPRPCGGARLMPSRHLPLQRQEATLSPKPWDSISRGKSQSHDSTDSGFSDNGEHHWTSSPGSSPHEHSMESLTESSMEVPDPQTVCQVDSTDPASAGGSKSKVSVQEKKQLEERISKIISKNDALMDDKHLENVRPRKTVLSKQGSIDLPMPYTYKDSFHFEMKSTTMSSVATSKQTSISPGPDRRGMQAFHSSLPSQHADSLDHAPLTRSSSLPFSVSEQQSEAAGTASPRHTDRLALNRRSSAGHLHSLKVGAQSVDRHEPSHRSLVRQGAVDCLPEASPTKRGSLSSLSSDSTDCCTDAAGEPAATRKYRRKRSQKFDYNKWYVYGDGIFRKLYSTSSEKEPEPSPLKTQKSLANSLEHHDDQREDIQISQVREPAAGTQVTVSIANMSVGTMQSVHCPSTSPGLGLAPADVSSCTDRRHSSAPSYVLLPGSVLKTTGPPLPPPPLQRTESRVILGADILSPKGSSIETGCEIVPQHGALPSERKKQRTEENVCVVLDGVDTGERRGSVPAYKIGWPDGDMTNGVNQALPPTERGHSRPHIQRQDSLIYLPVTARQPLQKRHSSPLCVLDVSRPSELAAASSNTSNTSTITTSLPAKSSFLPKYQLKLPETSGHVDPCPRRVAPLLRHSFSSSQIFTTCAPRSGHSDSITSFSTLTQSQPVTPITLIHSQQNRCDGSTRLSALGLPVPVPASTWSPSTAAVRGLTPHDFPARALGAPGPARSLRTTSDTPWTAQNQTLTMVTSSIPGQSYMCRTVLAQDQFGSITTPRHSQSVIPVISHNQTALTGTLCPEQRAKSLTDIHHTGAPVMPVQYHIQQVANVTDLARIPTATPTSVFSISHPIQPIAGVTLDQTATPAAVQCHSRQVTPAGFNQNNPVTQKTVFSSSRLVRDVSLNQTPLPIPLQYQIQQALPVPGLNQSISVKPITMFAASQPVKSGREIALSQTGTPVTVPYQIQQATAVIGLVQNVPVTANTILSTNPPAKHLTDLSLSQITPVVVQHQTQELAAVTPLEQNVPVTSTRIVSSCRAIKSSREMSISEAATPVTVQYHIQQATRLAQNVSANSTVVSSEPIQQVTDMALQHVATPVTVQCVIQQATPIRVLSQRSSSTTITTHALCQLSNPVTDLPLKQAAKPATAQYHFQQPTPIPHTQPAKPVAEDSPSLPPTAVPVRYHCQAAVSGVGNSQKASPLAVIPLNQPATPTPTAGVVQQLQTTYTSIDATAPGEPCASTPAVQSQGSTSVTAPQQSATHAPEPSAVCPLVDVTPEAHSTTAVPRESLHGAGGVGGVPAQAPTQDTFFMRTPDLQIVMQLISDEQLALMAPQIEAGDYKQGAGGASIITGSAAVPKTETSGQPPLVSQDTSVSVTNNGNDVNSTQGGCIASRIMSANGSTVTAMSDCATSVSTAKPSCPGSLFMNSNSSPTERPGQSQASVLQGTAQSLYIPGQTGTVTSQAIESGLKENQEVGQRDCVPAQLMVSGKNSTTEQGSVNAHISLHKQQHSLVRPTSPTRHDPTMQRCVGQAPESYQQSSLSGPQSSVSTERPCPPTMQESLPSKVGAPAPNQEHHLSGVPVGSTASVRSSAAVSAQRVVVDVEPQPSAVPSACHPSPPAAHCPSVSHHSPLSERTGSSHGVSQSGATPNAGDTTVTTQTNLQRCLLEMPSQPQTLTAEDRLGHTVPVSTEILASEPGRPQPLGCAPGLTPPPGSVQVLSGAVGLSRSNGPSLVLGGAEERSCSATLLDHVGSVSGSHATAGQRHLGPAACASPAAPPTAQSAGSGGASSHPASHPAMGQHKPPCPGDDAREDGCNHAALIRGSATEVCVPDKTSGEPQQSQRAAAGQAETTQTPSAGRRVESGGTRGAVGVDQGDARSMGVQPTQACIQQEKTVRIEETPYSSSITADQGPGDVLSPQSSPLPPGDCGSERQRKVPEEPWRGAEEEEEEEEEERGGAQEGGNNKRPEGQVGGNVGGGGRQNDGGADERMADPRAEEWTMKECNLRQEETSSHEPIWTLPVPLPPPPPPPPPPPSPPPPCPPPPSQGSPGMLLNLNLQLDSSSSPATPLYPPGHLTSSSSSSSCSSRHSIQSRTLCRSQPFVQCTTQAHSGRADAARCYQEPGEAAAVSSPKTGACAAAAAPPPRPSHGDLPLHSPSSSEATNHSEARWRKAHSLLGHAEQTFTCLSHPGETLSDSQNPEPLRTEAAQTHGVGERSNSRPNGPAPGRRLSRAAKVRSGEMVSLSRSLRGARKCIDDKEENSSSSDDEGKLVIEFESN